MNITTEPKYTVLIADDEEAPRAQIKAALARVWPEAKVVAECEHGVDAWDSYLEHDPDVCFLDIRMPGLTGLQVAQRITASDLDTHVVFCTAFNDHAVAAFEAGAADYLVKPVDDGRLEQAVARVKQRLDAGRTPATRMPGTLSPALQELMAQLPKAQLLRTIQASVGKEIRMIPVSDVVFFEADSRYTRVVHAGGEALIRTPLKELIAQLDTDEFWQIHRSTIVNTAHVASAVRVDDGIMHITLRGRPDKLSVSRHFQSLFKAQ